MLAEADLGMTSMAMGDGGNAGDEQLLVRFYIHPLQNETRSKEEGRPIFEDREYIEIIQPGNKDSIIRRPASHLDYERFPQHYAKYKARTEGEETIEGTLLEHWPGVTRSQVEELRYLNIRTVEQLANVADSNTGGFMGMNLLKRRAQEYLDASSTQAHAEEMQALKDQNRQLAEQLAAMQAKIDALGDDEVEKPRRRARRKAE
jgi:hypothetical protein